MATVIDALLVELGLDPSDFVKGSKSAKDASKQLNDSLNSLKGQVLALFAVFTAGKGLKDFIHDVVEADLQIGRLAATLNETVEELSNWRGTTRLLGGDANAITASMSTLTQEIQGFVLTGQSSMIPFFRALGVSIADQNGRLKTAGELYLELADKFKALGPAQATYFGHALGMDQGTINLLLQGRQAVQQLLDEQKRLGNVTKEDAEAAYALHLAFSELDQSSTSLGRTLLTTVAPVIVAITKGLTALAVFMRNHKDFLVAFFSVIAIGATAVTIALAPWVATVAAITAALVIMATQIGLLCDDFMTWERGGKSVLGNILGWVTSVASALKSVIGNALGWIENRVNGFWRSVFGHDLFKPAPTPAPTTKPAPAKTAADRAIDNVLKSEDPHLSGKVTNDTGGLTKYGISQNAFPGVDIKNLSLEQARAIYKSKYWDAIGGDKLPKNIQNDALDAAVNQGVGNVIKWLRESGGDQTKFDALRRQQYEHLAASNPSKYGKYLKGWEGRVTAQSSHSTTSVENHIGPVTIVTQAKDAAGMARDVGPALENQFSQQANSGAN